MRALTRRCGEEVVVIDTGEEIGFAPTGYRANKLRIGIQAPERSRIVRRELLERERRETQPVSCDPSLRDCRAQLPLVCGTLVGHSVAKQCDKPQAPATH
jgi:sRNA-binding carbon storage regulator CsrA